MLNVNIDKTEAIVHKDLLKTTWLNYKNSEDLLVHCLKHIEDPSIKEAINNFHNDLIDVDKIHSDIDNILIEFDEDLKEINNILLTFKAPSNIITSECLNIKFQWIVKQLKLQTSNLTKSQSDYEDKHVKLQHENHEIHQEYRNYVIRMQPLVERNEQLIREMEQITIQSQQIKQKLDTTEDEYLFINSTVENQQEEILSLKEVIIRLKNEKNILRSQINDANIKYNIISEDLNLVNNQNLMEKITNFNNKKMSLKEENLINYETTFLNDDTDYQNNGDNTCSQCSKYINKLLADLANINARYSLKREKHRQKLLEARSIYISKNEEFESQNTLLKETIDSLSEKLRLLNFRFQTVFFEKNKLTSRLIPLENNLTNANNRIILYEEKIENLENHIKRIMINLTEKLY